MTTPWVCYGQTIIAPNDVVQNPTPNTTGLVGECTSLPYTVPTGKVLVIQMFQMEHLWDGAMLPWIGDTISDFTAANCLSTMCGTATTSSAALFAQSMWVAGFNYHIPAGKKFNIRLNAGYAPTTGYRYGWYVGGELRDA